MKILVDCYGEFGEFFLDALLQKADKNKLFVKTYDNPENANLIFFLKSNKILFSTQSYRDANFEIKRPFDIIVSVFGREKIPVKFLSEAYLAFNYHPSLLPKYKGCFSIPWAIICGENETGYTIHEMTNEFDAGDIFLQRIVNINPNDTSFSLYAKVKSAMCKDLNQHINFIFNSSTIKRKRQVGNGDYYNRCLPFAGKIDPTWDLELVDRFVRAMIYPPFKPAILEKDEKQIPIYSIDCYKEILNR